MNERSKKPVKNTLVNPKKKILGYKEIERFIRTCAEIIPKREKSLKEIIKNSPKVKFKL